MSLVQQGTHTARNRNTPTRMTVATPTSVPRAIVMWKSDAHVLRSTCPACGNFVLGRTHANAIPTRASGFTNQRPPHPPVAVKTVYPGRDEGAQENVEGVERPKQGRGDVPRQAGVDNDRHDHDARDSPEGRERRVGPQFPGNGM